MVNTINPADCDRTTVYTGECRNFQDTEWITFNSGRRRSPNARDGNTWLIDVANGSFWMRDDQVRDLVRLVPARPITRDDLPWLTGGAVDQVVERLNASGWATAPTVTREQVEDELHTWSQPGMGREPLVDLVCRLFGVSAGKATDPVAEEARERAEPSWDAEDCDACTEVEDACRYHRGVSAGVQWVTSRLGAIASDPEWLNLIRQEAK